MSSDLQSSFNNFKTRLLIQPQQRTAKDVELIYRHLREMQANSKLSNSTVQTMAKNARYEIHNSNELLYTSNDVAYCWYILLCGSVFLDNCMFLPGSSFGKQSVLGKRGFDCLILERSEMIVIDYPNEKLFQPYQRTSYSMQDLETLLALEADEVKYEEDEYYPHEEYESYHNEYQSDAVQGDANLKISKIDDERDHRKREMDINLSGLKETMVDSIDSDDEDDISTASESASVRDIVRDCLEKDASERTENDINILMEFVQHLPAFNKVTQNVRREMCAVMVFAVVEKAGTDVMIDGEEMDSWSVILNGSVEVIQKGRAPITKHLGDSFGVNTTPGSVYNKGIMRTRVDDCQFVCIAREDYWQIFSQGEANTQRVEEEGEVVLVTEHRTTDGGSREGQVVIRGMPDRLLDHLMEDHSTIDPTYVEDYLLTYVIFKNKPLELAAKLLKWFDRGQLKDKVTRVMLLWVNNHYYDFACDRYMESCLERFELQLEAKKMLGQLRLLNMARTMKSVCRLITLERSAKDAKVEFSIIGGSDNNMKIFISKVDLESKAEESGLRKGDQILEVNGQSFENIKFSKAWSSLKSQLHLSMLVKSNIIAYKEAVELMQKTKKGGNRNDSIFRKHLFRPRAQGVARSSSDTCERQRPQDRSSYPGFMRAQKEENQPSSKRPESYTTGTYPGRQHGNVTKDAMKKAVRSILPRSGSNQELNSDDYQSHKNMQKPRAVESESNEYFEDGNQVIRVYRASDQSVKYFIINKKTTAQEVVIAAVEQFAITDTGGQPYFLCEVTATEDGLIKQKRLTNFATDLASRIGLSSRYFIKNSLSDGGLSTDVAQEIAREGTTTFLQLSPLDVARELTLQDFDLFKSIDSREYIYNLFDSKTSAKFKNLGRFEETVNTEMFWVAKEVCSELNVMKRVKMIKRFIKIAKLCNDFKNYNSMFALLSGLDHSSVRRLKSTWEKVPAKYVKIFEDLKLLMDPSSNMSRYRNLFNGERAYPPLIPFFPVIKKDLTFIHLGNETYVDGLVNFEKLRMIAKEVRKVCKYCAIGYDPGKMDDVSNSNSTGAPPSIAQSVVSVMTGQNTIGRRSKRINSGMANPKKVYEEALAARRMRQYLGNLSSTIPTEAEIIRLSELCEPPPPSSTLMAKRRLQNTSPISNKKPESLDRPKSQSSPVHVIEEEEEKRRPPRTSLDYSIERHSTSSPPVSAKGNPIVHKPFPEFLDKPDVEDLDEQVSVV